MITTRLGSMPLAMLCLGMCLAAGLTASGYFIGQTMYNGQVAINTASAKGLASACAADRVAWTVSFGPTTATRDGLSALREDMQQIGSLLSLKCSRRAFRRLIFNLNSLIVYRARRNDDGLLVEESTFWMAACVCILPP